MSDPDRASSHLIPSELVDWPKRLAREQPLMRRVLARLSTREVYGDMGTAAYDPHESHELVMVVG